MEPAKIENNDDEIEDNTEDNTKGRGHGK